MTSLSPVCNPLTCEAFTASVLETLELIRNHCRRYGYCWAGNADLAGKRKVSESTITRHISLFVKAGLLAIKRRRTERQLFPDFAKIEKALTQRRLSADSTPKTHAGAAKLQTKETKETFGEDNKQTAPAVPSDSPSASVPVVVSSAKAFPENASPEVSGNRDASPGETARSEADEKSSAGLENVGAICHALGLPGTPAPKPPAVASIQAAPGVETPTGTRPPSPMAAAPERKQEVAPVADVEIVSALHRAGVHLRAAESWAAKQPAECRRLLAALATVPGVRNKARWLVAGLKEAATGEAWAFVEPPKPKAAPQPAPEGESERREQKRRADADAVERAAEAQYEAIPKAERERLEAQAVAGLTDFMRRKWEVGKYAAKQAVRAAVVTRWRQEAANVGVS